MAPCLLLGMGMKSLDPLSEPTLVQWDQESFWCRTMVDLRWLQYAGSSCRNEGIATTEGLPCSPDLNPIEQHLWNILFPQTSCPGAQWSPPWSRPGRRSSRTPSVVSLALRPSTLSGVHTSWCVCVSVGRGRGVR